ncbi:molybdopterin molybdotransferase MoeA [Spirosoma soli]|uniref:Molybdopterin molybdenumtransferase n=1 Tax=Spirosoma soli TaxID=1770529 RepID=A0ABW5M346_9BACT
MLSVADAFAITQQYRLTLSIETVPFTAAAGRVLREAVRADRDFPPFDRVAMDGIAIRFADYAAGQRSFSVVGTQFAGQPQQMLEQTGSCLEAMTGAMVPAGTDTIIRYEDITLTNGQATITIDDVQLGQHIHHQATDRRAGNELLPVGTRLGPPELAVAASVGQTMLTVSALPRIALISTGDELVDVGETPLPYQIRRSNTYLLRAALATLGIDATLHHIADDQTQLQERLQELLTANDLLILSGGVSAGKADFVPDVLTRLGVQKRFHKIDQRPGKPLWFGTSADGKTVFALPGNPVSTVLCTYRYVMPYLKASLGLAPFVMSYAQLASPITFQPPITYFLPVRLTSEADGRTLAHPLPGSGSADFANLLDAGAFMELPAGQSEFGLGEAFPIWLTR